MLSNFDERSVAYSLRQSVAVKKLLMLVLVSVNHLLQPEASKTQERLITDDSMPEPQTMVPHQSEPLEENHNLTEEEIINL